MGALIERNKNQVIGIPLKIFFFLFNNETIVGSLLLEVTQLEKRQQRFLYFNLMIFRNRN